MTRFATVASVLTLGFSTALAADLPNIIYVLTDDLGIGDLSCYNAESKIQTPFVDRLAGEGMRFTDAHTPSAVCTPTRYGILTGRYCWRTRLKYRVLDGFDPPLITEDQVTVPSLLQDAGYDTHCVGKWHLGMQWTNKEGNPFPSIAKPHPVRAKTSTTPFPSPVVRSLLASTPGSGFRPPSICRRSATW